MYIASNISVRERATDKIKQVKQNMCLYLSSFTICHYGYRIFKKKLSLIGSNEVSLTPLDTRHIPKFHVPHQVCQDFDKQYFYHTSCYLTFGYRLIILWIIFLNNRHFVFNKILNDVIITL